MVDLLADFRTWPVDKPASACSFQSKQPAAVARGRTIILTTHQAHLAERLVERTLTMRAGTIVSMAGKTQPVHG